MNRSEHRTIRRSRSMEARAAYNQGYKDGVDNYRKTFQQMNEILAQRENEIKDATQWAIKVHMEGPRSTWHLPPLDESVRGDIIKINVTTSRLALLTAPKGVVAKLIADDIARKLVEAI